MVSAMQKVFSAVMSDVPEAEARTIVSDILIEMGLSADQVGVRTQAYFTPGFRFFLRYDPGDALRRVDVPVLALFFELDVKVPLEPNLTSARIHLRQAPTEDATVVVLPGINHMMQPAKSGLPEEYASIQTTVDPTILETLVGWLESRYGDGPG